MLDVEGYVRFSYLRLTLYYMGYPVNSWVNQAYDWNYVRESSSKAIPFVLQSYGQGEILVRGYVVCSICFNSDLHKGHRSDFSGFLTLAGRPMYVWQLSWKQSRLWLLKVLSGTKNDLYCVCVWGGVGFTEGYVKPSPSWDQGPWKCPHGLETLFTSVFMAVQPS